jgi:pilus assembly protein CpaF
VAVKGESAHASEESTRVVAGEVVSVDTKDAIRKSIHFLLLEEMGDDLEASGDEAMQRAQLERRLETLLGKESTPLSDDDRAEITKDVVDGLIGNGPLGALLLDPTVTEIMVNGPHELYVGRAGKLYPHRSTFVDGDHLRRVVRNLLRTAGHHTGLGDPLTDLRLPDGTLMNLVMPPQSLDGPHLTLRKPSRDPFTLDDLVAFGTMTDELAEFLAACVQGRLNILVSGGVRAGKTTLLNVLASSIPADERVIVVEEAAELQLRQEHVVTLATRPVGDGGGQSVVTARQLVANSRRMRPDRIIVGELAGAEVYDLLQAMNTGHDGAMATIYANSLTDGLDRVETMAMLGSSDMQRTVAKEQTASAIDLAVHISRLRDGTRRVVHVAEVCSVDAGVIEVGDLFRFDASGGLDEDGRFRGQIKSTGVRPRFAGRLEDMGVQLQQGLFEVG